MKNYTSGLIQEPQLVTTLIIGESQTAFQMRFLARRLGATDHKVLIQGETGVGKEITAREIHMNGRQNKPFVPVNCSALPENLVESELFGHKKGSFTGAIDDRQGFFETVEDGTLFLDEVGTLPPLSQVKILRVLQDGVFNPVGERRQIKMKARVIAGTNTNLDKAMLEGGFRSDLFYRLNVIPFFVPPLRERLEDVPLLLAHFLSKEKGNGKSKSFAPGAMLAMMQGYDWPGNIRELEHVVMRAVFFSNEETDIQAEHILPYLNNVVEGKISRTNSNSLVNSKSNYTNNGQFMMFEEVQKSYLQAALVWTKGNILKTAAITGISRPTIERWISLFGIRDFANLLKKR